MEFDLVKRHLELLREDEQGLGLVIYDSPKDKTRMIELLGGHCITIPDKVQYELEDKLEEIPEGAMVHLQGFDLNSPQFSALNFKRDTWYRFYLVQIWWMDIEFYTRAVVEMPDLISYFIPKLVL